MSAPQITNPITMKMTWENSQTKNSKKNDKYVQQFKDMHALQYNKNKKRNEMRKPIQDMKIETELLKKNPKIK